MAYENDNEEPKYTNWAEVYESTQGPDNDNEWNSNAPEPEAYDNGYDYEDRGWQDAEMPQPEPAAPAPEMAMPEGSDTHAYWHDLQTKYDADPEYQDPDGWGKDYVDQVNKTFTAKEQGKYEYYDAPALQQDDPAMVSIREQYRLNHHDTAPAPDAPVAPPETAPETDAALKQQTPEAQAGQTGEAYQQQVQQEQPEQTAAPLTGQEKPAEEKDFLHRLLPNLPQDQKQEAQVTEQKVVTTPQESVWENTALHDSFIKMYKDIGWSDSDAERLAYEAVMGLSDKEAKTMLFGENIATPVKNFAQDLWSNINDLGSLLNGVNPETGNHDRRDYFRMAMDSGNLYDQYKDQLSGIDKWEFQRKYTEYKWRTETGERYHGSINLAGFEETLPEELKADESIEGNRVLQGANYELFGSMPNENLYTQNDGESKRLFDPATLTPEQQQQSITMANDLWQIMAGDTPIPADTQSLPLTQEMLDTFLIDIVNAQAEGKLSDMLGIQKDGSIANMDTYEKAMFYFTSKAPGSTVQGASAAGEALGHNLVTSAMSAGIMGNFGELVGSIFGPAGAAAGKIIGLAVGFGIPYTEQLWGYELPYYDEILQAFDYLADKVEGMYGKFSLAYADQFGDIPFSDPGDYVKDLAKVVKYGDVIAANARENDKEYSRETWERIAPYAFDLGLTPDNSAFIRGLESIIPSFKMASQGQNPERGRLGENEVFRYNLGYSEKQTLAADAEERFRLLADYAQALQDIGVSPARIDQALAKYVSENMGVNAYFNEITYNEAFDPLNLAEGQSANAMLGIGKLTGDTNLQNAARAVRGDHVINGMDFLNFPGMEQAATALGKALGKEWQKTGGFSEIMEQYKNENRFGNLENTTAFGRRYSGIDNEGKLIGLDPEKHRNFGDEFKNFFAETEESRVLELTNMSQTLVNMGLGFADGDPQKMLDFIGMLEDPDSISPDNALYDLTHSAAFNTYKEDLIQAVKTQDPKIRAIIDSWQTLAPNRQALNNLAEALNVEPEDVISKAESDRYALANDLIKAADKNGGTLPGMDININDPDFANKVVNQIAPFVHTEKHPHRAPWNQMEISAQVSNLIGDGLQDIWMEKYHIKPDKAIYRFADAVKASQNFVLLGISGTYLPNNILNNVVTRRISGIGGFTWGGTINDYFTRFGVRSERFGDSIAYEIGQKSSQDVSDISAASKTQYTRMQEAISSRKEVKDALNKAKKAANWVNQHFGIMGNLSGKVEEQESKQAIYSGTKQYMDNTWRPGVNLTRLPAELEAAIEAQAPGMVKNIYGAIHNSLSMDEVNSSVLGEFVDPGVKQSFLNAAAERFGVNGSDVVNQMFSKTGLLDELEAELQGKDEAGRKKVFEDFARRLEADTNYQVSQHLTNVAEAVRTQVSMEGFKGAVESASTMLDIDFQSWLNSTDRWDKLFAQRLREPMTVSQWNAEVQNLQAMTDRNYQQLGAEKLQIFDGVLTGLGMDDEYKTAYISALQSIQQMHDALYNGTTAEDGTIINGQKQNFDEYKAKAKHQPGESEESWHARARAAWSEYQTKQETLYDAMARKELAAMDAMDKAFSDGMKAALGSAEELSFIDDIQQQIRDLRQKEIDINKEIRRQEKTLDTFQERDLLWEKYQSQRQDCRQQITQLQKSLYDQLAVWEEHMHKVIPDPAKLPDYDALVKASVTHEEASKMAAAAEKYSDRAWEKLNTADDTTPPQFFDLSNIPTVNEAEELFEKIKGHYSAEDAESIHHIIYAAAGLESEASLRPFFEMKDRIPAEDLNDIGVLIDKYNAQMEWETQIYEDALKLAKQISSRVYPDIELTDRSDPAQWEFLDKQNQDRDALARDIAWLAIDLAEKGESQDPEAFSRINARTTAEDWHTIVALAEKYNQEIYNINHPAPGSDAFHTEQVSDPYMHGVYTITGKVMDKEGNVVALVPVEMPLTEVHYSEDVSFPVLGLDPNDPEGIVWLAGDEPRTVSPKMFQPEKLDGDFSAYKPAAPVNTVPGLDPGAMAQQEMMQEQMLPLLKEVADRYESDLADARKTNVEMLDPETRQQLRDYLDITVSRDMATAKYKALRFGEMMRDVALLNYSKRYGFDNFLTMVAPYQFWLTRSAGQWMKRLTDHPRLFSHYYRVRELEDKYQDDYLPSRLKGKVGIPMPGWPSWTGGRTFINPVQLNPINNFLSPLESIDDNKHVAEQKTITELGRMVQEGLITPAQYDEALKTRSGLVWDSAYAKYSEGSEPSFGSLVESYFSPNIFANYLKAKWTGDESSLSHLPSTNVGNSLATAIGNAAPENETVQKASDAVRKTLSAPERALRDLFGFDYSEFGSFGDAIIGRRLIAMMNDGDISKDEAYGAWMQKDGNEIYDRAYNDVRKEMALRVPGGGLGLAVGDLFPTSENKAPVSEKMADLALQVMLSPFGQYLYPQGEQNFRETSEEFNHAMEEYKKGNKQPLTDYYNDVPEKTFQKMMNYKDPEMQFRYMLYDTIKTSYYALDSTQRKDVVTALGPKFEDALFGSGISGWETMPLEDLAGYSRALNGSLPYLQSPQLKGKDVPEYQVTFTPEATRNKIQTYYEVKDSYDGLQEALDTYYSLPTWKEKQAFRKGHKPLDQWLTYDENFRKHNPDADAVLKRNSNYNKMKYARPVYDALDNTVQGVLIDYALKGTGDIPAWVTYYVDKAIKETGSSENGVTMDSLLNYVRSTIK